jgi:hypothetical protein
LTTLAHVAGIEALTSSDRRALVDTAESVGIEPDHLAAVISFETARTFAPNVRNSASGATGLIQFLPSTAARLGTSTQALARMSFREQLEYVRRYFEGWGGQLRTLEAVYLAVFYPKAIFMAPADVVAEAGDPVYEQNKGFDHEGKGFIRRADITSTITAVLASAQSRPRLAVPASGQSWRSLMVLGAFAAVGAYLGYPKVRFATTRAVRRVVA